MAASTERKVRILIFPICLNECWRLVLGPSEKSRRELDICAFFNEVLSASGLIDDEITHDASYVDGIIWIPSVKSGTSRELDLTLAKV